ncbi:methyltransferase [Amycolatopsis nigrescens]|uniref:methyltransferase n=1 Tax=Amycolatopsis nigrescens TaxID=381445 RepID=UPI00036AEC7A|nr:methyltransferase [Amycolatopsis nigrescens]
MPDSSELEASRVRLAGLVFGSMSAQVIGWCARMKLADAIGDRERSAGELAAEFRTPVSTTNRLLRAMAALGVLAENSPGRYRLTTMGSLLRSDRAGSVYALARMCTDPMMLQAWYRLDDSVRTGRTTFDDVFGVSFFAHLKANPELSALFNAAMGQGSQGVADALPSAYDFGRFDTVMDVGGGNGTVLAAVLHAHPGLRGVLFDTGEGSAEAASTLQRAGVAERCAVEAGDFFTAVPAGAQVQLLKSVLHDWNDEWAGTILRNCRRALPRQGRLLVLEPVLPETVDPEKLPFSYLSDLNMLVNLGGLERTRSEFEALLRGSGFALTDVTPLPVPSGFCLIEATPA